MKGYYTMICYGIALILVNVSIVFQIRTNRLHDEAIGNLQKQITVIQQTNLARAVNGQHHPIETIAGMVEVLPEPKLAP